MKFYLFCCAALLLTSCSHLPTEPVDYAKIEGREAISQVVDFHLGEVRNCYEKELVSRPKLEARIVYKFKIDPSGRAHDVQLEKAEGCPVNDPLVNCIQQVIGTWKFPPAKTAETAKVSYPFTLRRSGSSFPN